MSKSVIWKPDSSVPYVIHCVSDEHYFLHGAVIIRPELVHFDDDPEGRVAFRFVMNRGHMFFGQHLRHTDAELWFARDEGNDKESFHIAPMTDAELVKFNDRFMRGDKPLTREGIVESYEEELRFG